MEQMTWTILGAMFAMMSLFTGIIVWMISKVHSDLSALNTRLDTHQVAINARVDQMTAALNARVDTTQAIIMRMLEKQGK